MGFYGLALQGKGLAEDASCESNGNSGVDACAKDVHCGAEQQHNTVGSPAATEAAYFGGVVMA